MTSAAIIPVRNRPALIAQAIRSVQAQTLSLDEIIVVDDASTDETPETVLTLAQQDPRIRLVPLREKGGASRARNQGIASTRCDWICFLDSDDEWMPAKHARQVLALRESPAALASFTGLRYRWSQEERDAPAPRQVSLDDLRRRNWLGSTSSAMVRRTALEAVGGFDAGLPSCQDWDLWLRLRRDGDFAIVPDPLVSFNQSETVRITRSREPVLEGHRLMLEKALAGVTSATERRRIRASHRLRLAGLNLYDLDDPTVAAGELARSFVQSPTREAIELSGPILRTLLRRVRRRLPFKRAAAYPVSSA